MDIGQMFPEQSSLSLASATLLPNCAAMSLYLVPQMHPHFLPSHHCPRQFDVITFCLKISPKLVALTKRYSYYNCLTGSYVISVRWAKPASLPNLHTRSTLCLHFDLYYPAPPPKILGPTHLCSTDASPAWLPDNDEWQVPVIAHSCGQKSLLISNEGPRTHSQPCPNCLNWNTIWVLFQWERKMNVVRTKMESSRKSSTNKDCLTVTMQMTLPVYHLQTSLEVATTSYRKYFYKAISQETSYLSLDRGPCCYSSPWPQSTVSKVPDGIFIIFVFNHFLLPQSLLRRSQFIMGWVTIIMICWSQVNSMAPWEILSWFFNLVWYSSVLFLLAFLLRWVRYI